jgi:hypothetical protein
MIPTCFGAGCACEGLRVKRMVPLGCAGQINVPLRLQTDADRARWKRRGCTILRANIQVAPPKHPYAVAVPRMGAKGCPRFKAAPSTHTHADTVASMGDRGLLESWLKPQCTHTTHANTVANMGQRGVNVSRLHHQRTPARSQWQAWEQTGMRTSRLPHQRTSTQSVSEAW